MVARVRTRSCSTCASSAHGTTRRHAVMLACGITSRSPGIDRQGHASDGSLLHQCRVDANGEGPDWVTGVRSSDSRVAPTRELEPGRGCILTAGRLAHHPQPLLPKPASWDRVWESTPQ